MRSLPIGLLALLWCARASAEPTSASARFEAGLAAIERGELEAGLREFEAAYAIQPRHAVLFNIGQAHASLGRPVEAIATFERFLAEGGKQISEERRAQVRRLIEQNRKLTGALALKLEAPDQTRVWLDGSPVSAEAATAPLPLPIGEHRLLYSYGSGYPIELELRIESRKTSEIVIPRPPAPVAPRPASPVASTGNLAVDCTVAGIAIDVAGRAAGRTPLREALSVSAGSVRLTFRREGFEPVTRDVWVPPGVTARVACLLPLVPTRASVERERAAARKRFIGWSLAGAGLASLGASAAIYAWNQGRYDDWRAERTAERPLVDRAVSIQRADDAAVGLLVLGAGLSAAAVWSLVTTD